MLKKTNDSEKNNQVSKIRTNIPIPPAIKSGGRTKGNSKFPVALLNVNDSFEVKLGKYKTAIGTISSIRAVIKSYRENGDLIPEHAKFTMRSTKTTVTCWRTK